MKALSASHPERTRPALLAQAAAIPGAGTGIRLATLLAAPKTHPPPREQRR